MPVSTGNGSLIGDIRVPTSEIAERTIAIRKNLRIKIPDAIIAATALEYSLQLVSRNEEDFSQIQDLKLVNPFQQ